MHALGIILKEILYFVLCIILYKQSYWDVFVLKILLFLCDCVHVPWERLASGYVVAFWLGWHSLSINTY